jgi:HPt (histidine-containing phosphotransfer) domain-containing protein
MAASRSEGTEAVHHMYAQFVEEAEQAISAMRQKLARQVQ